MTEPKRPDAVPEARVRRSYEVSGQHVRCAEAQADGVPCPESPADCEYCNYGLLAVWRDGEWVELPPAIDSN